MITRDREFEPGPRHKSHPDKNPIFWPDPENWVFVWMTSAIFVWMESGLNFQGFVRGGGVFFRPKLPGSADLAQELKNWQENGQGERKRTREPYRE